VAIDKKIMVPSNTPQSCNSHAVTLKKKCAESYRCCNQQFTNKQMDCKKRKLESEDGDGANKRFKPKETPPKIKYNIVMATKGPTWTEAERKFIKRMSTDL
jgi:hypothetical protein